MPPRGGYPPGFPPEYARPRWLDRKACADYICVRRSALARLTKQGLLPKPSLHLGPRTPRWDREAVDALFLGSVSRAQDPDALVDKVVAGILAEAEGKRQRRAERAAAEAERKARRELLRDTRA